MTETISAPDAQALKIRVSHDMPGRQAHIQHCVEEILVKVSGTAAAS